MGVDKKAGESVQEVEEKVYTKLVLAAPDLDKKMRMEVDVLDYTMGGMLLIKGEDRLWRLVAFLSKSLNETERNYEIHDKEMLVIIQRLKSWRHLLKGVQSKFEI